MQPVGQRWSYGKTFCREADGLLQQVSQSKRAAPGAAERVGGIPTRNHTGHSAGSQRPAQRNGHKALLRKEIPRDIFARAPTGVDAVQCACGRLVRQPEVVAADAAHLRVHNGQHRSHGHGGVKGGAALAQDIHASLCGKVVWRCDHAPCGHGVKTLGFRFRIGAGCKVHGVSCWGG